MNAMRQLDSGNSDGCIVERLEAGHPGTAAFYRAKVLLNNIVEVLAGPHFDVPPLWIFPSKQSRGSMTRRMAVQRHLARPSWAIGSLIRNPFFGARILG